MIAPYLFQPFRRAEVSLRLIKKQQFRCECCNYTSSPTDSSPHGFMQVIECNNKRWGVCGVCADYCLLYDSLSQNISGDEDVDQKGWLIYHPDATQAKVMHMFRLMQQHKMSQEGAGREELGAFQSDLLNGGRSQLKLLLPTITSGTIIDVFKVYNFLNNDMRDKWTHIAKSICFFPKIDFYKNQNDLCVPELNSD